MAKEKCVIQCRLRVGKDDDLRKVINDLSPSKDKSDLIRDALRLYFFGNKKNDIHAPASVHKKEEPIHLEKKEQAEDIVSSRLDDLLGCF